MIRRSFVLLIGRDDWQLGVVEAGGSSVVAVAGAETDALRIVNVRAILDEHKYRGEAILIGIPSAWCLCAVIDTAGLPHRARRQAMAYRLEDQLPFAAEEVVATFLPIEATSLALGFCVEVQRLAPLLAALEASGVLVQSICPTAILAASHLLGPNHPPDAILLSAKGSTDLLILEAGQVAGWNYVPAGDDKTVLRALRIAAETKNRPLRLSVQNATLAPDADLLAESCIVTLLENCESSEALATTAAADVLNGRKKPLVDFRIDALHANDQLQRIRLPAAWAAAALVLLSLCLTGAMLIRASAYRHAAEARSSELDAIFAKALPGQLVPAAARSRLISEERRLRALAGDGAQMPHLSSALRELHNVLSALPKDVRFRILSLRIEDGKLDVRGQARSHSDADAIVSSLRSAGNFTIESPRTEQLGGEGVAFSFSATAKENRSALLVAGGRTP